MNTQQDKDRSEKNRKVVVGISHGDFNGISYEIIIKTFMETRMLEICTPVLYGSSKVASYYRKVMNVTDFSFNLVKRADMAHSKRANIVNITDKEVKIDLGESSQIAGQMAVASLDMAIGDIKSGYVDVLVTAPLNKKNVQSPDFNFPGHTEYLANRFDITHPLMIMVSDKTRIGFVTGHVPLNKVVSEISTELIKLKLIALNNSLIRDFGIRKPKIAILGINPHSGDNGVIGTEEQIIISPAIKQSIDDNILAFGPYPSDSFFASGNYLNFDAVLAMYHDQGMMAFKMLSFDQGVNFTAGLPVVRTSPAHGTAYDIVGKNEANPESFRQAIYLAVDVYNNRQQFDKLNDNPLVIKTPTAEDSVEE